MAGAAGGVIRITTVVDDKASQPLKKLQTNVEELQRGFGDTTGTVTDAAKSFIGFGGASLSTAATIGVVVGAITAATVAFTEYAKSAIAAADEDNKLTKSFRAIIGDAEKTSKVLDDLGNFAGFTAFTGEDVKAVALRLLQTGVAAEDLIPTLAGLGGAAQGNVETFKALVGQFQSLADSPKVSLKSIRAFADNGVDALGLLSEAVGQTREQFANNINQMNMSGADAARLLLAKSAEKFGATMLSDVENIDHLLARAADSADNAQETLGHALEPLRKVTLKEEVAYFDGLTKFFKDTFDNPIFTRLFGEGGAVPEAITNISEMLGPVFRVIGQVGRVVALVLGQLFVFAGVVAKVLTPVFLAIETALQPAFEVFDALADFFIAIGEIVRDAASAFAELLAPIFGITGEFNIFSATLRFLASMIRTATEYLRAFGKLLKPLWDWLRSISNMVKDAADGIRQFFTALGLGPKSGADAASGSDFFKNALLNLIPVIGPVIPLIESFATALGLIPSQKTVDVKVNVPNVSDVSTNVSVNVTAPNVSVLDNIKTKLSELVNKEISVDLKVGDSVTQADLLKQALSWYRPDLAILFTAGTTVATIAVERFHALLGETPTNLSTDVSVTTEPAQTQVDNFNTSIRNIPTVQTSVGVFIADASRELLKYIQDMFTVPTVITTGFSLAFGSAFTELLNWTGALAAIPRMITTVLNTVQGNNQVADQSGQQASVNAGTDVVMEGGRQTSAGATTSGGSGDVIAGAVIIGGAAMGIGAGAGFGGGGCFVGDTLVATPSGYVPIDQLTVGTLVNLYTSEGSLAAAPIAEVFVFEDKPLYQVVTWTPTGGYFETIDVTAEHPFAVEYVTDDNVRSYEFIRTAYLQVGMSLRNAYGVTRHVHSVRTLGYNATVYNLEVDHPEHTYLVGKFKHVVHNRKGAGGEDWLLLASGGIVMKPTPAIVGEAGPEAVIPLAQLNDMVSGNGGVNIGSLTINVAGNFSDPTAAGVSAADAFRRQLGLQRRMLFQTT